MCDENIELKKNESRLNERGAEAWEKVLGNKKLLCLSKEEATSEKSLQLFYSNASMEILLAPNRVTVVQASPTPTPTPYPARAEPIK